MREFLEVKRSELSWAKENGLKTLTILIQSCMDRTLVAMAKEPQSNSQLTLF